MISDEKKPKVDEWRRTVAPNTPSSSIHLPVDRPPKLRDDGIECNSETATPADRGVGQRPGFFHRWNPRLEKVRNVVWVYMGFMIFCQLLITPTWPMDKHMSVLENSNPVLSHLWWLTAANGAAQREYWRRQRRRDLDGWVEQERTVAWDRISRNIGPIAGAPDGVVIASPSRGETPDQPDYYYTWTRDAALTMSTLASHFLPLYYEQSWRTPGMSGHYSLGNCTTHLLVEPLVRAYIDAQAAAQITTNPSGDLWTGGLNEPKLQVDGSEFDGEWGRPQRDGPALRALTLIPYANYLLDRAWPADVQYVRSHLYDPHALRQAGSVIKNDLEEVGGGWWLSSFDLWEEVDGHHLFTLLACLRALQAGTRLAERLDDPKAAEYYAAQVKRLIDIIPAFWNDRGYWQSTAHIETVNTTTHRGTEREWLDCALPLSVSHFGSDDLLAATDPETLASLRAYLKSFVGIYAINAPHRRDLSTRWYDWLQNHGPQPGQADWARGWAVGRYAEDVYNGIGTGRGNPWHICTYAVARVFYLAKEGFESQGYVALNNLTRPFWQDILGSAYKDDEEVWTQSDARGPFALALRRLEEVGDMYMTVGRRYAHAGRMSEQIDRHDGSPIGARDLTWSYASFLDAARARDRARIHDYP